MLTAGEVTTATMLIVAFTPSFGSQDGNQVKLFR
jgi:hypothetical protein